MRSGYEEIESPHTPPPTAQAITLESCFRGLNALTKLILIMISLFLLSVALSLCLSMAWSPVKHIDPPSSM